MFIPQKMLMVQAMMRMLFSSGSDFLFDFYVAQHAWLLTKHKIKDS